MNQDAGESKTIARRAKRRRPRPNMFNDLWVDTRTITLDTHALSNLTLGSPERLHVAIALILYVWRTQQSLPHDISDWSPQDIRGRLRVDSRRARKWFLSVRDEVIAITARRAPLCEGGREWVFEKSDGLCHHCGVALTFEDFHVDHLQPVALGGLGHNDNLVASCPPCNWRKGGRAP